MLTAHKIQLKHGANTATKVSAILQRQRQQKTIGATNIKTTCTTDITLFIKHKRSVAVAVATDICWSAVQVELSRT